MNKHNTRRGNTQEIVNAANQNKSHCRMSLSGIFNACCCNNKENPLLNGYVEDPQLQPLWMTTYVMSGSHPTYKGYSARSVTPQGQYAGYSGRIGFTLIELLVVVLIIGILAAVALPQYQKAVKKAQGREIMVTMDALDKGFTAYYLSNGGPLNVITSEDLDIALPRLKYAKYTDSYSSSSSSSTFAIIRPENPGADGIPGKHWNSLIQVGSTSFWWMFTENRTFKYCRSYPYCSDTSKCPPCEDYVHCNFMQVGTSTECTF